MRRVDPDGVTVAEVVSAAPSTGAPESVQVLPSGLVCNIPFPAASPSDQASGVSQVSVAELDFNNATAPSEGLEAASVGSEPKAIFVLSVTVSESVSALLGFIDIGAEGHAIEVLREQGLRYGGVQSQQKDGRDQAATAQGRSGFESGRIHFKVLCYFFKCERERKIEGFYGPSGSRASRIR